MLVRPALCFTFNATSHVAMLFNSRDFLVFFAIVVALYYSLAHRKRGILLLIASYYFYMSWQPAYIVLILTSTVAAYLCGLKMGPGVDKRSRKAYLIISLVCNLGLLFVFKYLNFFGYTVKTMLGYSPVEAAAPVLNVLLPVGISFYTFQTLSYTIDVYRGDREPETRLGQFALYVSFFPQLVAGPIERSTRLLPQFDREVQFDYERVTDGLRLMLWGMFKKVVIADTAAKLVDPVYGDLTAHQGPALATATFLFAFQIYCDFSGYSDIAIGAAKVLGFDLMENFHRPYFAKSIREFWRRWHISLSTWFRDYLYIPLGGNRVSEMRHYFNLTIVFLLCGLWHGASWTFVVWGALHGMFMVVGGATAQLRERISAAVGLDRVPEIHKVVKIVVTFGLTCFAWIFFRAQNISDAWYVISHLATGWDDLSGTYILDTPVALIVVLTAIAIMEIVHFVQRGGPVREKLKAGPVWLRWGFYYAAVIAILLLGSSEGQEFIYFQF